MTNKEIESFVLKFKNLQYAAIKASLPLEAENGEAVVTMKANLALLNAVKQLLQLLQLLKKRLFKLKKLKEKLFKLKNLWLLKMLIHNLKWLK